MIILHLLVTEARRPCYSGVANPAKEQQFGDNSQVLKEVLISITNNNQPWDTKN